MGIEKREHVRTDKPFVLELRIKPSESLKVFPSGWNVASVKNLGAGGVLLYYNERLEVGSAVDLRIFPPNSAYIIVCSGRVLRMENNVKPSLYNIVVKFTTANEQIKEIIDKIVKKGSTE